ncbi:MAG: DMT family transporter [Paracoccaceae bacterium]
MTLKTGFYLALVLIGAAWGLTFPLTKLAVSTGHQPLGIIVWQQVGALLLTGLLCILRGSSLKLKRQNFGLYLGIALLGTVVPSYFSYTAASHLPAGVMSIIIALVPLVALPIALIMGYETPMLKRMLGLVFGAVAVVLLVGPGANLPEPGSAIFVPVAMLATLAYGGEANFLEWSSRQKSGLMPDPFQILFGASLVGLIITLPLAMGLGHFINLSVDWSTPERSILYITILSTLAYSGYIWLISRTGPVFAAQVAYLVTGFGVLWSLYLLDETYSAWVWLALAMILAGLFLVQPKLRETRP